MFEAHWGGQVATHHVVPGSRCQPTVGRSVLAVVVVLLVLHRLSRRLTLDCYFSVWQLPCFSFLSSSVLDFLCSFVCCSFFKFQIIPATLGRLGLDTFSFLFLLAQVAVFCWSGRGKALISVLCGNKTLAVHCSCASHVCSQATRSEHLKTTQIMFLSTPQDYIIRLNLSDLSLSSFFFLSHTRTYTYFLHNRTQPVHLRT